MKKYLLALTMIISISHEVISQGNSRGRNPRTDNDKCGMLIDENAYNTALQQLGGQLQALTTGFDPDDVLLIPVVVHNIYNYAPNSITLSQAKYVIKIINEDFAINLLPLDVVIK